MKIRTPAKKVSDMTIDELKSVIHEVITEDMEAWRETFEIMADKKLMRQIKQADLDWASGAKASYVSWDDLKNVWSRRAIKNMGRLMKGVEFIVDDSGKKKAVLIELEHWGDLREDFYDILVSEARKNEPTVSWSRLKLETDLVDQR